VRSWLQGDFTTGISIETITLSNEDYLVSWLGFQLDALARPLPALVHVRTAGFRDPQFNPSLADLRTAKTQRNSRVSRASARHVKSLPIIRPRSVPALIMAILRSRRCRSCHPH
jgi:hypothetical protein